MSESQLQREILEAVGSRTPLWRQNAGRVQLINGRWMDLAPAGAADLTGILADGRRLEIEVKSATGQQREAQRAWQRMILSKGGVYILARSVDEALRQL